MSKLQKIFILSNIFILTFFIHPLIETPKEVNVITNDINKIVEITNKDRIENGKKELKINEKLVLSANSKAIDMFNNDYFEHVSPDGIDLVYLINEVDYNYYYVGENLAKNYTYVEIMQKTFMNSPDHRKNILDDNFKEIGVAILDDYVVIHFGASN